MDALHAFPNAGFDDERVRAEIEDALAQMTAVFAAMRPALEQVAEAARQMWDVICEWVRRTVQTLIRWCHSPPPSVRYAIRRNARSETIMRRKIRRAALLAQRR